jgi:hypothetical protein
MRKPRKKSQFAFPMGELALQALIKVRLKFLSYASNGFESIGSLFNS